MAEAYTVIRSLEQFTAAREQFNFLVSRLQSEEMSRMEHGQVEATIAQEGKAVKCIYSYPAPYADNRPSA